MRAFLEWWGRRKTPSAADMVREIRAVTGLSQAALAALVGCDASTVARWEAEESTPSARNMIALTEIHQEVRRRWR
jgi:DNA-binding transcriptional regulator YiaG